VARVVNDIRTDPLTGVTVVFDEARHDRPRGIDVISTVPVGSCPFCLGHERDTPPEVLAVRERGEPDTPGWTVRVVPNRYPAFARHEVVIVSPDHSARVGELEPAALASALSAMAARVGDIGRDPDVRSVMWFQNQGPLAGATQPHAHWQIAGMPLESPVLEREVLLSRAAFEVEGACGYCSRLGEIDAAHPAYVASTDAFVAWAPIAPRVPFETWIAPRIHAAGFHGDLPDALSLATLLIDVLGRIDRVLDRPDFNLVCHALHGERMRDEHDHRAYHWHLELLPRTVRIAGFEFSSGLFLNGVRPERAAAHLRDG
jgi:UDPglucose--hexose-1-phosphate uridylyltransferase